MNLQLDVAASSGTKALSRSPMGGTSPCCHKGDFDLRPFSVSVALPSRFAYYGSKARADLMHAGAALMAEEVRRVVNVCNFWKANPWKPVTDSCTGKR